MGINLGGFVAPLVTGWLASVITNTPQQQNYRVVFVATGIGMALSYLWFWFGRRQLGAIGRPPPGREGSKTMLGVIVGCAIVAPIVYVLIWRVGAYWLAWLLGALFVVVAAALVAEGVREGSIKRDRVIAMLVMFAFNVLFWMFFEQAGSSFNFLAENIVDRNLGGWEFPTGWFQSVNPLSIVVIAPLVALIWGWMSRRNIEPSIPRKFGLGLIGNALAFLVLMYALKDLVGPDRPHSVLAARRVLRAADARRALPVADRPLDGDEARAAARGRTLDGRLVPVAGDRQQHVGPARRQDQRRDRHDRRVRAGRIHVQFLSARRRRRGAVPDRAADQSADARHQVRRGFPLSRSRERVGLGQARGALQSALIRLRHLLPQAGEGNVAHSTGASLSRICVSTRFSSAVR